MKKRRARAPHIGDTLIAALAILIAAPAMSLGQPPLKPGSGRPVLIQIAYATPDTFFLYRLEAPDYDSSYRLLYTHVATTPRSSASPPVLVETVRVSGSEGRTLAALFWNLRVSWEPQDYWYEPFEGDLQGPEGAERTTPCGVLNYSDRSLIACPISGWASGGDSCEANKLAWFIQRLNVARADNVRDPDVARTRREAAQAITNVLRSVPRTLELSVRPQSAKRGVSAGTPLPVGVLTRRSAAAALVFAKLVSDPLESPDPEVRLSAINWCSEKPLGSGSRAMLLRGLRDPDRDVRIAAAYALAARVEPLDKQGVEELREFVRSEADPSVRQLIRGMLPPGVELDLKASPTQGSGSRAGEGSR